MRNVKLYEFVLFSIVCFLFPIQLNDLTVTLPNIDRYEAFSEKINGHEQKNVNNENVRSVLKDKNILIDAGHGGHDVGAIGATETYEKNITYTTATKLKHALTSLGANVFITRENDHFISLEARSAHSNIQDIDVFLSLHYNSFPEQPNVSGIETYYYHNQHKELAHHIQAELIKVTNAQDRDISKGDYLVLRQTLKPAVLIELGFISNKETENMLQTDPYQQKLVIGIINGLREYFHQK